MLGHPLHKHRIAGTVGQAGVAPVADLEADSAGVVARAPARLVDHGRAGVNPDHGAALTHEVGQPGEAGPGPAPDVAGGPR